MDLYARLNWHPNHMQSDLHHAVVDCRRMPRLDGDVINFWSGPRSGRTEALAHEMAWLLFSEQGLGACCAPTYMLANLLWRRTCDLLDSTDVNLSYNLETGIARAPSIRVVRLYGDDIPSHPHANFIAHEHAAMPILSATTLIASKGLFLVAVDTDPHGFIGHRIEAPSQGPCPECHDTGLRGGFQVPCSRGCRIS